MKSVSLSKENNVVLVITHRKKDDKFVIENVSSKEFELRESWNLDKVNKKFIGKLWNKKDTWKGSNRIIGSVVIGAGGTRVLNSKNYEAFIKKLNKNTGYNIIKYDSNTINVYKVTEEK